VDKFCSGKSLNDDHGHASGLVLVGKQEVIQKRACGKRGLERRGDSWNQKIAVRCWLRCGPKKGDVCGVGFRARAFRKRIGHSHCLRSCTRSICSKVRFRRSKSRSGAMNMMNSSELSELALAAKACGRISDDRMALVSPC
jgi:hypothetical protein